MNLLERWAIRRDISGKLKYKGHELEIAPIGKSSSYANIGGAHALVFARLFSLAPELLAECERFLGLLQRNNGNITQTPEGIEQLRAVIARARGEDLLADWKYEIANNDTRLGFAAWCKQRADES